MTDTTRIPATEVAGVYGKLVRFALLEELGPAAMVELGARVGLMNATARGNIALGIRSERFSDSCGLPLASRPAVAGVA